MDMTKNGKDAQMVMTLYHVYIQFDNSNLEHTTSMVFIESLGGYYENNSKRCTRTT